MLTLFFCFLGLFVLGLLVKSLGRSSGDKSAVAIGGVLSGCGQLGCGCMALAAIALVVIVVLLFLGAGSSKQKTPPPSPTPAVSQGV